MEDFDSACPCVTSDLDLWHKPPRQNGILYSYELTLNPQTSIDQETIDFFIPGAGEEYTDPANSYLILEGKLVKADGTNLAENANVAPVNNLLHSLISQVDITLNDVLITPSNNLYAYKAYIENLLSYGVEAQNSHLTASMFFKETPGKMHLLTDENTSFTKRKTLTATSKTFQVQARLHTELCHQLKPIINGVDMRIRLVKSNQAFIVIREANEQENFKIKITNAYFIVRRIKLNPDLQKNHMMKLQKEPAVYPVKRVTMKVATIQKDCRDYRNETFYTGDIPNKMFFCFVLNEAFNGHRAKNPFIFNHFKINYIAIYVDGQQIPGKPITPDFTNGLYCRSFMKTMEATGTSNTAFGPNLTYDDFKKGYAIFGYDLTPHLANGDIATKRKGKVQIEVKFKDVLENTITMIVYSEFDNNIYIDRDRHIIFDYTS